MAVKVAQRTYAAGVGGWGEDDETFLSQSCPFQ